jgi:hypothetical protein
VTQFAKLQALCALFVSVAAPWILRDDNRV